MVPFVFNLRSLRNVPETAWVRLFRSTCKPKNMTHFLLSANLFLKETVKEIRTAHRQILQSNFRINRFSSSSDQVKLGSNTCRHSYCDFSYVSRQCSATSGSWNGFFLSEKMVFSSSDSIGLDTNVSYFGGGSDLPAMMDREFSTIESDSGVSKSGAISCIECRLVLLNRHHSSDNRETILQTL